MSHSITNFSAYHERLAAGAQPSETDIQALAEEGYRVIINISPVSARNSLKNEAELVERAGMYYIHFPVDCSNLQPIHYQTFKGIMTGVTDEKTFVHCGGNIKSSNLIHMYAVLENNADEAESLKILRKIQQPEQKWFAYFKLMGMRGVE
jgi:protein tyrosine phosphatase (PTP) superfamily phosphohydrolase (DUF442 family)